MKEKPLDIKFGIFELIDDDKSKLATSEMFKTYHDAIKWLQENASENKRFIIAEIFTR